VTYKFPNLAGVTGADTTVEAELTAAGVQTLELPTNLEGEVRTNIIGLGLRRADVAFVFTRAWHYWRVRGNVPLDVANELYKNYGRIGREEVRAGGDAGWRPPETWVHYIGPTGKQLVEIQPHEKINDIIRKNPKAILVKDPTQGMPVVQLYHIDSPEGLRMFAELMRKHILMA